MFVDVFDKFYIVMPLLLCCTDTADKEARDKARADRQRRMGETYMLFPRLSAAPCACGPIYVPDCLLQ